MWYLVFNSSDRVWGMYVQGNNRYCIRDTLFQSLSLSPIPVWYPVQKLRPIFLVDKSIHDEASRFKNQARQSDDPNNG